MEPKSFLDCYAYFELWSPIYFSAFMFVSDSLNLPASFFFHSTCLCVSVGPKITHPHLCVFDCSVWMYVPNVPDDVVFTDFHLCISAWLTSWENFWIPQMLNASLSLCANGSQTEIICSEFCVLKSNFFFYLWKICRFRQYLSLLIVPKRWMMGVTIYVGLYYGLQCHGGEVMSSNWKGFWGSSGSYISVQQSNTEE